MSSPLIYLKRTNSRFNGSMSVKSILKKLLDLTPLLAIPMILVVLLSIHTLLDKDLDVFLCNREGLWHMDLGS